MRKNILRSPILGLLITLIVIVQPDPRKSEAKVPQLPPGGDHACAASVTSVTFDNPVTSGTLYDANTNTYSTNILWHIQWSCNDGTSNPACRLCFRVKTYQSTGDANGPWGNPILDTFFQSTMEDCNGSNTGTSTSSWTRLSPNTYYKMVFYIAPYDPTTADCSLQTNYTLYDTRTFQTPTP